MPRPVRQVAAIALLTAIALTGFTSAPQHSSAPQRSSAKLAGRSGGTLRLVAAFGPDHLDTVPAYFTGDYILERAYARQLLTYPAVPDRSAQAPGWKADTTPAPDVATAVPTVANGGITNSGTTYTFHLRPGVEWNTKPARQVVADDFLREFKAFCNPISQVGNLSYFTATIKGMQAYCTAETRHFFQAGTVPTASQIASYQNSHAISGITTPNPATIQFHLIRPASDFDDIMALPFTSARPVEYDKFLPDSLALDRHTISDGPYQISSYEPGLSIMLRRNPAWHQSSDPIRHQFAAKITVRIGVTSPETQVARLRAGADDLMLDTAVSPDEIRSLRSDRDFHVWPGGFLDPYIVFNLRSPNSKHAVARLDVRRAIEVGVSKAAAQRALGGAQDLPILNTVLPPGSSGHVRKNPYPTPGSRGNPARCRADLARAGFRHGLKLVYTFPDDPSDTRVFGTIRASLKRCGITLTARPVPASTYFTGLGETGKTAKRGTFDLAAAGWFPDWFGNNGRSIIGSLFESHCVPGTFNYGCYSNRSVDALIKAAETAQSDHAATTFWRLASQRIMSDAAIVPLVDAQSPIYSSARVHEVGVTHGVVSLPNLGGPDITNVWIGAPESIRAALRSDKA